jgi:drug efflux transport system permease protein
MRKALAVGRKEFRQIVRDRRSLMILLFIPVFFLLLYGYALNFDIRHIAIAVEDRDVTPESRRLISAFVNSGYFDLAAQTHSREEARRLMDDNTVRALVVIPEGLGRDVRTGRGSSVQIVINGDNATTATTVMGYAVAIVRGVSADLTLERFGLPAVAPPIMAEPRVWFNPELRSALFLVPGLIAFIGMVTAAVSTALSIVREKERGTWEQVRMAPMNTVSYVVGKTIPYLGISFASAMGIIFAAMVLFGLPMRGSWLLLLSAVLIFLVGALGTGLLISTMVESQLLAFQVVLIATFLPSFILSGFIFPIASMPAPIRAVTYVIPARYFLSALRGIVLKGVGLPVVWGALVALAVYAIGVLGLASLRLARQRG